MKQLKFVVLSFLCLLLINCNQDDSGKSPDISGKNYKIETKSLEQLKSDKNFENSISPFLKRVPSDNLNLRSSLEDKNEFTIDSSEVKIITGEKEYVSYTFGILREFVKDDSFENIVFEYNENSSTPKVSVIKYNVNLTTQSPTIAEVFLIDFITGERASAQENCWTIFFEYGTYCPHSGQHPYGTTAAGGCAGGWEIITASMEVCKVVTPSSPEPNPAVVYQPATGATPIPAHGHGGGSAAATPSTSPIPLNTPEYNRKKLISKLTLEQKDYFLESSEETQGAVFSFLSTNNYSDDAFEMLVNIIREGESYDTSILELLSVSNEFSEDKLCQGNKAMSVLFKGSSPFREMLKDELLRTFDINVEFSNAPAANFDHPNIMATTSANLTYDPITNTPIIPIVFNNNLLQSSTDLGIVIVSQHELLHAYFHSLHNNGTLLATHPNLTALNTSLNNYYASPTTSNSNIMSEELHNAFLSFIPAMAADLVEYGVDNHIAGLDINYATSLVWGGLQGTALFNSNALTISQRYNAQVAIANEKNNSNGKKGTKTCP